MSKQPFMPRDDMGKQAWLKNFANKLPNYTAKYGIAAPDLTDIQNGSAAFDYWMDYRNQQNEFFAKLTKYKNEQRDGIAAGATPSVDPAPPAMAAPPTAVPPGIFARATSLAVIIKKKTNYTDADGSDLGIIGAEDTTDVNLLKPILKLQLINGGQPEILWSKQGTDGVEIYKDSGDGNFVLLAIDTYPNYTDTTPLPAGATSAVWKYKAIYRVNDSHVGQWSDVASITV